jgi:hypothetical protein
MISFQSVTVSARAADGPKAPAMNIPASINGNGVLCLAPVATGPVFMVVSMVSLLWSASGWRDIAAGAQTERRGDAGPVDPEGAPLS